MKKNIIFLLLSFISVTTFSAAYADASICNDPNDPNKVAQCMYLTGLSNADGQRWIKVDSNAFNGVFCFGSLEQTARYIIEEAYFPIQQNTPPETGTVSICTDATGNNCMPLANFSLSCQTSGGPQGSCTPETLPIDVSTVKNKFPSCASMNKRIFSSK